MSNRNITGIILAGGKSSRMGTDKGVLILNGKTIVAHIIDALKPAVDNIIIIANNDHYNNYGFKVYKDIVKDCGPMGGIYTGLLNSQTNLNMVVSCDIPNISTDIINKIISHADKNDITVPIHNNNLEPLCAVYNKNCISTFEKLITDKEWKMKESFKYFQTTKVELNEKDFENYFTNINTPSEFLKQTTQAHEI